MYSILFPKEQYYQQMKLLSETTMHDLGMDVIIKALTSKDVEQSFIMRTMSLVSYDPDIAKYRCDVFEDILNNKDMRTSIVDILEQINFLKDYGTFHREYEESAAIWDLLHRLEEINDYIKCVEALVSCLNRASIKSEGLINLRTFINEIYETRAFEELKKDIKRLKADTSDLRSVTVGINLNSRFEAESIGLISVNNKYFTKAGVIGNFIDKLSIKDDIKDHTNWDENYKYYEVDLKSGINNVMENLKKINMVKVHPAMGMSLASVPDKSEATDVTRYMNKITDHMLTLTAKKLRETLKNYVTVTITDITNLIPEFSYYIHWAKFVEEMQGKGYGFSKAIPVGKDIETKACGIYNLKLPLNGVKYKEVVYNDFDFSAEHCVYILTGANRGGKTTITQAIGQLFVLAQGGIYIPGQSFTFAPVDAIYTHFPADEDQTMDLGRLGEECQRFREMYVSCTSKSLLLLNETFSTTSFEEGYYIAKDSLRAILKKKIRTLYNTHMHKVAADIKGLNEESNDVKAQSLVVFSENGKRSFKIAIGPPEGQSYAKDIATKYGVTYEMLVDK